MKNLPVILVLAVAALGVCGLMFNGGTPGFGDPVLARGDGDGNQTWNISFVGFCDGMTLTKTANQRYLEGTYCGCLTVDVMGTISSSLDGTLSAHVHPDEAALGKFQYIIRADHTWVLFDQNGVFNSGEWVSGCPPAAAAGLPSTLDFRGEPVAASGGAPSFEIGFDTFCDGMSVSKVADIRLMLGAQCGCVTDSVMATVGGDGATRSAHIHVDEITTGRKLQYIVRQNGTWDLYERGFGLFNSGTWSKGCPPVGVGGGLLSTRD